MQKHDGGPGDPQHCGWGCVYMCSVGGVGGGMCEGHKSGPEGRFQGAGPSSPGWATCLPSYLLPSSPGAFSGYGARAGAP